jgi:D-arginine dehydrogenase
MFVGRHDQRDAISALAAEVEQLRLIDGAEVCSRVPILNQDYVACGLLGKSGGDLDVDALLQGYRRQLKARGGILLTATKVEAMEFEQGSWSVKTTKGSFSAPSVVNAAGAWADQVAALAGADPLNIQPKRRTAMLVDLSAEFEFADWPLVVDVDEQFYLKPNAGQLLLSPADETPSEPCDAQADEFDIAVAIDRISRATSLEVSHIKHRWAGLRSFAPDHTFVVGQDSRREGFFWLAGQGGYGVQSAPALAQLTSHLLTQSTLVGDFKDIAAYKQAVSPERFSKD